MNALTAVGADDVAVPRLALLGTGTVGSAFIARYQRLQTRGAALPELRWLANSRAVLTCDQGLDLHLQQARAAAYSQQAASDWDDRDMLSAGDVVVDATASDDVAARHAQWLARGVHVVTANKLGHGTQLRRSRDIVIGCAGSGARYGDSATVGAGLPLLSSLRALRAGGDHIHSIEGVLSGSLAWLFHRHDGTRPFSAAVHEALAAGFTEPDPRIDLSGEDVLRKLLILARASGIALDADQVQVESLVPAALAALTASEALQQLSVLDAPLQRCWHDAAACGHILRFIARVDHHGARIGLRALAPGHPLAQGAGTDNRVVIHSDRYAEQPLVIQGPGAGAHITAAALLDDVLRVATFGTRPISKYAGRG